MKILSSSQIKLADYHTIKNEPISSNDLMERAANECFLWINNRFSKDYKIVIFAGTGNNGGDGLVIARKFAELGYSVDINIVRFSDKSSDDFNINFNRLNECSNIKIIELSNDYIPDFQYSEKTIIIDSIIGNGLSKPIDGFVGEIIKKINKVKCFKIAIDIPSGLFVENNDSNKGEIVCSHYTLTFQQPKLSLLFPENFKYVGDLVCLPIGLDLVYINTLDSNYYFIELSDIRNILKPRLKFDHKGVWGHSLIIAGSKGKIGAAVLSAKSCLRCGVGLLTVHVPSIGYSIIQNSAPEAMCEIDINSDFITEIKINDKYSSIAIGPGIGKEKQTANMLKLLIQNSPIPLIFDADAINILAENKTWLPFIKAGSIFTPHQGEFDRLLGKSESTFKKLNLAKEFCFKYSVYLILKGANSVLVTPSGEMFFNSTGNPGMATGGSGDVLTGAIASFKAQGYSSRDSCLMAMFIHGLSGDIASIDNGYESLIAGDIVDNFPKAFNLIRQEV